MKHSWLDRAPLPCGVLREGRFVYVNQALVALTGIPWETLRGRPFLERVAAPDRERMQERHQRRLLGQPVPDTYEFEMLHADGSRRAMEVWITTDGDGDVIFQLAERTARAMHQEKLGALARIGVEVQAERTREAVFAAVSRGLTALGMAMVRLAPDGHGKPGMRIVAVSAPGDLVERFQAAVGVGPEEHLGAWGPGALLAWRDGGAYLDDMPLATTRFFDGAAAPTAATLTRAASLAHGVVIRIDVAGRPAELLLMMADWLLPEHLPACRLFGAQVSAALEAQGLLADLRRSYADLGRAQEQLVTRERLAAIGELAAVVAHEVRNPLGVFFNSLGAFRRILGAQVSDQARTLLEIMEEESARLNHIVGDLLDFARPTAPALHRERLEAIVDEAVAAALGEGHGNITVVREGEPLPLVPMDARLMRQALLNLTENAVQAMPEGGTLTVRLAADLVDHVPMARVAVADTGPGIPPDVEPRIFEPFFTTRATGTGLGLAVVKRIVDSHRGKLRVSTAEGRGATFTVWLPLEEEPGFSPVDGLDGSKPGPC
jgi:PAS domain S-box-containing protein